jgi:hypothetical protein
VGSGVGVPLLPRAKVLVTKLPLYSDTIDGDALQIVRPSASLQAEGAGGLKLLMLTASTAG